MRVRKKHLFIIAVGLLLTYVGFMQSRSVSAAPVTLTVNSVNDTGDANPGNGACQTATPGECTLRAAIEEANSNGNPSDQDVIRFGFSGSSVRTINVGSPLYILQNVLIDGYTQPGTTANTAAYPAALNGTLLIELTGENAKLNLNSNADNSVIRGLIMNESDIGSITIDLGGDNVKIEGNYIGTDSSGLISTWGDTGTHAINSSGANSVIGGTDPAARNVVSSRGSYFTGYDVSGTVLKGNNFGIGSDSLTPLPQDITFGSSVAGVSIVNSNNVEVGGSAAGEGNYIANTVFLGGVLVHNTTNVTIQGNQIVDNSIGVNLMAATSDVTIGGTTAGARNIISGNIDNIYGAGIILGDTVDSVAIQGNYIGVDSDGVTPLPNSHVAIGAQAASNVTIGGTTAGARNIISGNSLLGIDARGINTVIQGNYIGVGIDGTTSVPNGDSGIRTEGSTARGVIGGVTPQEANVIANNGSDGIYITNDSQFSVLGNSTYNNGGLGIDLGLDGVNQNDLLDPDTGSNNLLNYPKLLVPVESGGNTEVSYRVDVPAGEYRIEFFSNTAYDPSGYGEGGTFIDSDTIISSGGGPQLFTTPLTGDTHENISATLTEIDPLSASGFGATSEFSGQPFTESNLSVGKSVVDQTTIATDGTIQYDISLTNTGIDPIDLTQYVVDNGDPLNTALFNDIFPNNLTLTSVIGDADCTEQNSASDFGTLFSAHTDPAHTVASCSYTGLSTELNPSATLEFTLTFTLTNPAENVFSNTILTVPSSSDVDHADYEDTLSSDNDIIDELNGNIDNLAVATTTQPTSDVSITKELLTSTDDVEAGGTLSYQLTYTNNGDDPLYISGNPPLASLPLFYDFTHPDLSIIAGDVDLEDDPLSGVNTLDVDNQDLLCFEGQPGMAALLGLTTYSSYGFVGCWYIGSDLSLASGDSYTVTLNFDIAEDSDLDFANYAFAYPNMGGSQDPDTTNIDDASAAGDDLLDGLINYVDNPINNFAGSRLPIDVTVSSEVIDPPATISEGTPIKLQVTLQNNGPAAFNFSHYPAYVEAVFSTLFSGNDLTFEGVQDDLLPCINTGTGGAAFLGAAGQDHPGIENVVCVGSGSDIIVPAGESQSITLLFSAKSTVSSNFGFYSVNAAASDPDIPALFGAIFGASEDVLDIIENNNYSAASYSGTVVVNPGGNTGGSSGNNQNNSNNLSNTGQNIAVLIAAGIILMFTSFVIYKKTKKNPL